MKGLNNPFTGRPREAVCGPDEPNYDDQPDCSECRAGKMILQSVVHRTGYNVEEHVCDNDECGWREVTDVADDDDAD
jgi:hypothetical protein